MPKSAGSLALIDRVFSGTALNLTRVRALMTFAVLAAGSMLAGCNSDQLALANNAKANQPVPAKLAAAMSEKNMDPQSPLLIRVFKQEAELEVWKQDRNGKFALLKTYPICRWSGDLGPKVREGDRQAPEGFYSISPSQMNPASAYYLSFNTGYPNAYDKSLGHTGSELMVHGDCSSAGCYAMTDEQIAEIFAMGRDAFFGGQRAFQFQAYPFHMTALNMAKHRNNPAMPFWRMIKEGYDHFEVTRQEPKVDFCEHKYVFDAQRAPGAPRDPVFDASAKCPAYSVPDEITAAVQDKQRIDDAEFAKFVSKGTPVARLNTGIDGGMNQIFASQVPDGTTGLSDGPDSKGLSLRTFARAPGTIPPSVNPPRAAPAEETLTAEATLPSNRIAAVAAPDKASLVSSMRKVGATGALQANSAAATSRPTESKTASVVPKPPTVKPAETKQATAHAPQKPIAAAPAPGPAAAAAAPAQTAMVSGAQPIVPTSSFDNRFSAFK